MKLLFSPSHNPFFNLALEEYLSNYEDSESSFFLLYRNTPAVVMGKNQNAWEEMNYSYLKSQGVQLSRRISGGGTVYHDLQNLNFCFIKPLDTKLVANYDSMLEPIVSFLHTLDLDAYIGKRSDIWINERKITGTAQYTNRTRFITHGTLLFDTDLDHLQKTITPPESIEVSSKSLKSVRSKVTNIRSLLQNSNLTIEDFERKLADFVLQILEVQKQEHQLSAEDSKRVKKLADEKYRSFEWVWGRSPACHIKRNVRYRGSKIKISISLKRGAIIESIHTEQNLLNKNLQSLEGEIYNKTNLTKCLASAGFSQEEIKDWI